MAQHRYETHDLDGTGPTRTRVYDMESRGFDYWPAVTDVPCPVCNGGMILWHEAGYVPGYRVCDKCERHFLARGNAERPTLLRVGRRKGLPVLL